jgi:hypothetical protein
LHFVDRRRVNLDIRCAGIGRIHGLGEHGERLALSRRTGSGTFSDIESEWDLD